MGTQTLVGTPMATGIYKGREVLINLDSIKNNGRGLLNASLEIIISNVSKQIPFFVAHRSLELNQKQQTIVNKATRKVVGASRQRDRSNKESLEYHR